MTKILIIEDSAELREDFAFILSDEGYEVFVAQDGLEGVQAALERQPDLILCDIEMPKLNVYEVLKALRLKAQVCPNFIFIGAKPNLAYLQQEFQLGREAVLAKYFTIESLLACVEACLNRANRAS